MAGAIAQDWESCQFPFVLDEKPTGVPGGSAGERSGGAREVPYRSPQIQSERRRRLALAGGFRLLRLFGINRLDEPRGTWRGGVGRAEHFDNHRRIFDGGSILQ